MTPASATAVPVSLINDWAQHEQHNTSNQHHDGQDHRTHDTLPTPNILACVICGETFLTIATLAVHMKTERLPWVYKCATCDSWFWSEDARNSHTAIEHPRYDCMQCDATFPTRVSLRDHIQEHSQKDHDYTNAPTWTCQPCRRSFSTEDAKAQHNSAIHCICDKCQKVFYSKSALEQHDRIKHSPHTRTFVCELCPERSFRSYDALGEHKQAKHN